MTQTPDSPHARAILDNIKFYTEFLLPIIRSYCQMKGWEQVPVAVLGSAGIPDATEDFSTYPDYQPFAYRDREAREKKTKTKRKSSPMKLSVV